MNKLKFILLISIALFGVNVAYSQCCCSDVLFQVLDKKNKPIPKEKLEVKNLTERFQSSKDFGISFYYYPEIVFAIGCGYSDELILIRYKGKEMRLYLNMHGDFGGVRGKFKFKKGDFLAEFDKGTSGDVKNFSVRKMTKEELENK